jgi:hypothetical protein
VFPEAIQIVDLYHVRQHLHDLAGVLEFMLGGQRGDWLAARLDDLDHGDIDGICQAARVYPLAGTKKDELDTAPGVLRAQRARPRMRAGVRTGPTSGTPPARLHDRCAAVRLCQALPGACCQRSGPSAGIGR